MIVNDAILKNSEKAVFALRELYLSNGYAPYRMSKFEEYDLYAENKDFLISDNVITFTDTDGKLMALKPDVTLSIIKNSVDCPEKTQKVFYDENVYRVSKSTDSYREMLQTGVECFGRVTAKDISEVVSLAAESLTVFSDRAVIALSDLDVLSELIERLHLDGDRQKRLYAAIGDKNAHEIARLCENADDSQAVDLLQRLLKVSGTVREAVPALDNLIADVQAYSCFRDILVQVSSSPFADKIQVDFSVTGDIHYYNGVVFKGFLWDIPTAVLSGGQYDKLMTRMGRKSCAVGFAVYTDSLERIDVADQAGKTDDGYVNIALPKGRLGEKIYDLFEKAGLECPSIKEPNRKLIFENAEKKLRYFWVKPSDVAIYVERGAADIGVAGKDILLEYQPDVYELLDLKKGVCRMAVAAPKGYRDDTSRTLKVATKFAGIAKEFYRDEGRDIDIIHLNGSIEIAPILGLSDVIVDIVETGTTLKENDLEVIQTILPISARLIANKSSYKFRFDRIRDIAERLSAITEE